MVGGSRFLGASAARLLVVKFLAALNPAADVMALASLEVDVGSLEPGNCMIVKWRGKPVFVRARTEEEIEQAQAVSLGELRDRSKPLCASNLPALSEIFVGRQ